ncbi:MAG: class I SAM-dependent methyltransferase [Thermodesulfobacteriota bacterium]
MSQQPIDADAFRDFERAAHDEIADGYRNFFTAVTEYAVEPLLDAAAVGPGARVLDVATGPGALAFRAANRGASSVIGVDLSPQMVRLAVAAYPCVEFRQGDAEDLPFHDRSFDAVVSNFGIGHFPRPERALGEFLRVVTQGGVVAVSWWDVPARHRVNGIFFDAINEAGAYPPPELPTGPPMFRFSDDQELSAALRSVGLAEVGVQAFSFTHLLASPEDLWNGILSGTVRTSIGIRRQPKVVQDRIRAAFDRLVKVYERHGRISVPVAFWIASGRRPFD